jgi:hypothetical protein
LNSDVIFAVKLELLDLEVKSHVKECNILSSKKKTKVDMKRAAVV